MPTLSTFDVTTQAFSSPATERLWHALRAHALDDGADPNALDAPGLSSTEPGSSLMTIEDPLDVSHSLSSIFGAVPAFVGAPLQPLTPTVKRTSTCVAPLEFCRLTQQPEALLLLLAHGADPLNIFERIPLPSRAGSLANP